MSRFFRIYFAGIVKSEDVMGGGEAVEAAFGGGERMEGRAAGIDQTGEEFGGDRFARIMRSDEIEDGVVVEGGVLGGTQGGQRPVEDGLPGGVMARLVETEQFSKRTQGALRGFGADGFGEDLLDLIEEEGGEAGVDGPAGAGDGGVPGAAGVEGQDDGGLDRVGEMVEGSGSAVVVVGDEGRPIDRVPGGAEVDARGTGVEEKGGEAGVDGPAGAGDGGVPGAAGVEGQDDGGLDRVGEMVEGSGSAVVVVADDGRPIVRVPGGAEIDARGPGVEEAAAFHGSEAVADLTDGRERGAEFGAAVGD